MLLQTNSYIVPKDKRAEHARLMQRFRQCFKRLGSIFEVYEATGPNFSGDGGGRFVQIMRFRDRHHQQEIHDLERQDPVAQQLIADFCRLVNLSYQQQHGLFTAGYYAGVLRDRPTDKPELVVGEEDEIHRRAEESEGSAAEEEQEPERELSVEDAFAQYLGPPAREYPVDQQIEPDEFSDEGDGDDRSGRRSAGSAR
jgi:hypothetical protein